MKKSDLIWAICDIDEDLLRLTEEEPVMTKKHTRPLRIVLIAAVIAVLLAGTVLAYAIRHWDELFVSAFQVDNSDKELLDSAFQDVYAQTTQDGVTCTVTQLLGTEHCLVAALELKLPENLETGTTSAEELKTLTADNDLPWQSDEDAVSASQMLSHYFGYDPTWTDFPDAPYAEFISLAPVTMEKADLLAKLDKEYTSTEYTKDIPEELQKDSLVNRILFDQASKELGTGEDGWNDYGIEFIKCSYDPETHTLTELLCFNSSLSLPGRSYTLVIPQLYFQSMKTFFSPDNLLGSAGQSLLTSPMVLHFTADYQPQKQSFYNILQNGTTIGSLELSPVSAHLTFPQEPDDPNRLAPNRHDYLKNNSDLRIRMADGKEIKLRERSSGFADDQFAFYLADDIIDLTQVQEVCLGSYTLTLAQ